MKPARRRAFIWPRTVLSLTRIGMLTPATTSAPVSRATKRLKLVGVSPSMSVRMIAPSPRSTPRTALAMRSRIASGGSLSAVTTLTRPSSGPRTPSSVCTLPSARRPCPTTTIPTMTRCLLPRPPSGKQSAQLALGVAVADEHAVATLREPAAQLVDEHDRAMAAARAAERDGEVALPLALVERQGEGEEVEHAAEELLALLAAQHPVGDRRVGPGPGPQLLDEEGVGEEAAVERQVGVGRQAVLVAERDEGDRHRTRLGALDEVAPRAAQLVHGERARVEDAAGDLAQRPQLLALAPDAVGEHAALGRGMRAARLAEAAHEHVVARLEVEHLERDAARAQPLEDAREFVEEVPLAHVEAERHAPHLLARALPHLDEAGDERHRQVVDAVEAQVLEHLDGGALARAGEPGHDHEVETLGHTKLGARPVLGRCAPCGPTPARLPPRAPDPVGQLERSRARPPLVLVAGVLARCARCGPTPARLPPRAPDQRPPRSRRAWLERSRARVPL